MEWLDLYFGAPLDKAKVPIGPIVYVLTFPDVNTRVLGVRVRTKIGFSCSFQESRKSAYKTHSASNQARVKYYIPFQDEREARDFETHLKKRFSRWSTEISKELFDLTLEQLSEIPELAVVWKKMRRSGDPQTSFDQFL